MKYLKNISIFLLFSIGIADLASPMVSKFKFTIGEPSPRVA